MKTDDLTMIAPGIRNRLNVVPVEEWPLFKKRPLVIAGPCSAESEEQVLATAAALSASGRVDLFRAGIWKPRTRPGQFEGVGSPGLRWLRRVKDEYGLPVAVEVATERHVYEALKHGVDAVWIGARTSVNPFAMHEIASALKDSDVMVFVKNPVNPDLELWIGALERISRAGITRIAAVHRGFSTWEKCSFRNQPRWQIAVELRQRIPGIGLLCDPSHMGGDRDFIGDLSQKAMDLHYDGLMIESHINPAGALSDRKQQITPVELMKVLGSLVLRSPTTDDPEFLETIEDLRSQIDMYDNLLLDILESRMQVAETIGRYKKEHGITILQSSRWREVKDNAVDKGVRKGLTPEFIQAVLEAIHQESITHQMKVMKEG
ncbi:MAG: bifunctional 3-deoxy-7-phosphoheptulonate synthase/chorismate mutase type II [Bacteroidales bacterium]|jgi:chorismate mutase|nr:bifunctional 3-deoxy-7-phosphoheptulonate synthase/chorismate mutase type II [Bacteroidales bacterium]MDX9927164.1 chorismate mutase [Bacteroidales bacterium]HNX84956.1 chorismate mutase [Bacteroidales bacterium]HOC48250.1 chorismate mutase [Bacteroidales bacterium]HPS98583.1 chorismate mutase [Bacteroidales bacterium]